MTQLLGVLYELGAALAGEEEIDLLCLDFMK